MPETAVDPVRRQRRLLLESRVDGGLTGIGSAIDALLDLHRERHNEDCGLSWDDYVGGRWPKSARHIRRLLAREEVAAAVSGPALCAEDQTDAIGQAPPLPEPNEAQARELNRLTARPDAQREVWAAVVQMARATGKRVTARMTRLAVDQFFAAESDEDPTPEEVMAAERRTRQSAQADDRVRALREIVGAVRRVERALGRLDSGEQEACEAWIAAAPAFLREG